MAQVYGVSRGDDGSAAEAKVAEGGEAGRWMLLSRIAVQASQQLFFLVAARVLGPNDLSGVNAYVTKKML